MIEHTFNNQNKQPTVHTGEIELSDYTTENILDSKVTENIDVPVNGVADKMVVEQLWNFDELIPQTAIDAIAHQGDKVYGRYEEAISTIERVSQSEYELFKAKFELGQTSIAKSNSEYLRWYVNAEAGLKNSISKIQAHFDQMVQNAELSKAEHTADCERKIKNAKDKFESISNAIAKFQKAIDNGKDAQTINEKSLNDAIDEINALIVELRQLRTDLDQQQEQLQKLNEDLLYSEERRDELIDEKNIIIRKEKKARFDAAKEDILKLGDQFVDPTETVLAQIEALKQAATSEDIKQIENEKAENERERAINDRDILDTVSSIDGVELTIDRIAKRLDVIPHLLDEQRNKLSYELETIAPQIKSHSLGSVSVTETFEAISRGSNVSIHGNAIADIPRSVYESLSTMQEALKDDNGDIATWELPEVVFDVELPYALNPSNDPSNNPLMLSDLSDANTANNEPKLSDRLELINDINFIRKIRKGLLHYGARVTVKTNGNESRED